MTYKVKSNIKHDGKNYAKGELIVLSEELAKPLLTDGIIVESTETIEEEEVPVQPAVNEVSHDGDEVEGKVEVKEGVETEVLPEEEEAPVEEEKEEDNL